MQLERRKERKASSGTAPALDVGVIIGDLSAGLMSSLHCVLLHLAFDPSTLGNYAEWHNRSMILVYNNSLSTYTKKSFIKNSGQMLQHEKIKILHLRWYRSPL
jgi:hypothetical protein